MFIDADKPGYVAYWDELVPRVRPGRAAARRQRPVVGPHRRRTSRATDANLAALRAFNDHVAADRRVEAAVLPAFDGLTIARKR